HVESTRRFERFYHSISAALVHADEGVAWGVGPYSFFLRDHAVWEPGAPLDRIPYALFAAGVRTLGLTKGVSVEELGELLRLFTLDPANDIAREDDLVTLLWESSFSHVKVGATDTHEEGTQEDRARFETERR